ncbi:hypothetical protein J0A68_04970 [Algoriphagus sp. H41]|uniref:Uncharacterized protein n=1 Tax=Algoriphagus oliviformis TaxID=2811231 RepID=A0ABS3BZL7_9BACT|nr:hypothetical protein [Algoriphagus oliviformis]MBN7810297.1 hypothetical protein [Algoriphagus oliviformis]
MEEKTKKATWKAHPENEEWNDARNWEDGEMPDESAVFSQSDKTVITFSTLDCARVGQLDFEPGAPSFSFRFGSSPNKPALDIHGVGIRNKSGHSQSFVVAATAANFRTPQLRFSNKATAGGEEMSYYSGPESLEDGYGGGIISFFDQATAGTARFVVRTGKLAPPKTERSTVGGEVAFCDYSTAERAEFTIYGSLGIDGDTFGNTVFHDHATAAHGRFTNIGGTVAGGDGGNTQFYDSSTAAHGVFINLGGTFYKANGGDVAFDGTASGAHGHFLNYPATVDGGNGGVTSFNNNWPDMGTEGASAGEATYHNYGATGAHRGGGGHTEFTAKYGCPTAAKATIINYGSAIPGKSTAGHTIFSISLPTQHFPTAGNAVIRNLPALNADAAPGNTSFAMYADSEKNSTNPSPPPSGTDPLQSQPKDQVPTAGEALVINEGGSVPGAAGGFTSFSGVSSAGNSRLVAHGGMNGGQGGKVVFADWASGGTCHVCLYGNGELDLGWMSQKLSIGLLETAGGIVAMALGSKGFGLELGSQLILHSGTLSFRFFGSESSGFDFGQDYEVLTAPNLSCFNVGQFAANDLDGASPHFTLSGNKLSVSYSKS